MTSSSSSHHANVIPSEVGWQFVPQYYTFVNKEPHRLHCFYSKNSTFTHGTEGEDVKSCFGQQEIHNKITALGFENCKVFIHSVDAQSSANGGIIIQVIGEMSNHGETWRKFVQTFFLAEQPNGYFVLNDIFRFLKEESIDDSEGSDVEAPVEAASIQPQPATPVIGALAEPVAQPAPPVAPEPVYEHPREATPAPPPPVVVVEDAPVTIAPVEEPPKPAEPTSEPALAPALVPEQPAQPNGHVTEPDVIPVPTPPSAQPSPKPTPPPALSAPSPAPAPPTTSAAPAAPPHPPATTAPPQPRSWASLAASNPKKWGPVAQVSETVAPSSSPGSGSQTPATPSSTSAVAAAHPHHGRPNQQRNDHPALVAAQSVATAHCFVKGVTEGVTQTLLEQTLITRFGPIKDLEILRNKACAFLEFQSVDSARKAIIASLSQQQGGEGGVWVDIAGDQHRISIETKKDKAERGPSRPYRGGAPAGQTNGDRGGAPQGGGNFRGRGGGGRGGSRGGPPK